MKKTIRDFELNSKRVIIRCDLNVPLKDNVVLEDTRIKSSVRTIKYAIKSSAKVILLSHLGKVKSAEDKKNNSLKPVVEILSKYLNKEVIFSPDTRSISLTEKVNNLKDGDVLLVENTRFEDLDNNKESNCDEELSKYWASLGDIFINDAYASSHRNHASVTGIPKYLPSGIGFLVEKEIKKIDSLVNSNTHPYIVILGGKKISDKIVLIENLLKKCDKLIIGGAMSFTFLKAAGKEVGSSIVSEEHITFSRDMLSKYPDKIILPKDFVADNTVKDIKDFTSKDIGYDIGPKTVKLFTKEIKDAKRVIMNGPMGLFEDPRYSSGTDKILKALTKYKVKTVIGGGDTANAVNTLGYSDLFYHVSTGGGATLKYLESGRLIGLDAIEDKK